MNKLIHSPIILTGPSGVGKSELIDYIEKQDPIFLEAYGSTTRKPRENEVGKMNFISRMEFEKLIANNDLIEYCNYKNNYYGVAKSEFNKMETNNLIFNVGYSSANVIKQMYERAVMIYLLAPTKEELLRRLGNRDYERYLLGIKETMENALKYEYLLISQTNDFLHTYNDFIDIVNQNSNSTQKRLILEKNKDFVRNFYK